MLVTVSAFLAGVAFVILVEVLFIYRWFRGIPYEEPQLIPQHQPVRNPKEIADFCNVDGATDSENCMFLNLIFQFLWKEWRDSPKTRNFFIKKMNMEFKEMLLNKAAGRLMEQITVKDYFLGDSLPVFKNVTVMKIDTRNPSQVPREIDVALDVEYSGGFIISLDVDLIFGKSASLTVKINSLVGRMRLQLTRNPCTHWSFSFYDDPVMDIKVESNFQGKNLPKLTSFISNQIRRSIKNKHTLPRYKVRYKPFFIQEKPQDGKNEVFLHNSLITTGKIDVEIVECTRLPQLPKGSHIYCTLSLDSLPWKEDMPMRRSLWPVHEVLIRRAPSGIIGLSVDQEFETIDEEKHEIVLIESVKPNSPASQVDILRGDILMSVNNVDIITIKQALRLLKIAGKKFTIKIQRPPSQKERRKSKIVEEYINNSDKKSDIDFAESSNLDPNNSIEEANVESFTNNGIENSFDYNSIVLDDNDSETEEFVNIVVHEIVKELEEEDDEAKQQILNEVKLMQQKSCYNKKDYANDDCSIGSNATLSSEHTLNIDMIDNGSVDGLQLNNTVIQKKNLSSRLRNRFRRTKVPSSDTSSLKSNDSSLKTTKNLESSKKAKKKRVKVVEDNEYIGSSSNNIKEPLGVDNISQISNENDWDNISQHHCDSEEAIFNEDEKEVAGQKSSIVAANQEPVWNEIFSFDVEKEHKFLNVCVWAKCEDALESNVLIGYVSIPLMELAMECFSTTAHKSIQTFFLVATASRSNISRTYLRVVMPGLNLDCCNGDITLAYKYTTAIPECDLEGEEMELINDQLKNTKNVTGEMQSSSNVQEDSSKEHNFMGTEFYFPTRCDYCQNKVWRKVAFQCRVCAMVSHKRCIVNAQNNTYCTPNGVRAKPPVWQKNEEDICEVDNKPDQFSPARAYPFNVPGEMDLRPGIKNNRHSPTVLRRRNLSQKLFDANIYEEKENDVFLEENKENDISDSIATAAVTAKEAGRELFASLDELDREKSIQNKVETLQYEIQKENEKETELRKMLLQNKIDIEIKNKIKSSILKSEERGQGLKLLMIQYCSALEECFARDEPQQM